MKNIDGKLHLNDSLGMLTAVGSYYQLTTPASCAYEITKYKILFFSYGLCGPVSIQILHILQPLP
jgi:hypothetical protein